MDQICNFERLMYEMYNGMILQVRGLAMGSRIGLAVFGDHR